MVFDLVLRRVMLCRVMLCRVMWPNQESFHRFTVDKDSCFPSRENHLLAHVFVRFRSIEAMHLAGQLSCRSVLLCGHQVAVGVTVTAFQF